MFITTFVCQIVTDFHDAVTFFRSRMTSSFSQLLTPPVSGVASNLNHARQCEFVDLKEKSDETYNLLLSAQLLLAVQWSLASRILSRLA